MPDQYPELAAFIQLIVVNCIILGRAEAFASKNSVGYAVLDALGSERWRVHTWALHPPALIAPLPLIERCGNW